MAQKKFDYLNLLENGFFFFLVVQIHESSHLDSAILEDKPEVWIVELEQYLYIYMLQFIQIIYCRVAIYGKT